MLCKCAVVVCLYIFYQFGQFIFLLFVLSFAEVNEQKQFSFYWWISNKQTNACSTKCASFFVCWNLLEEIFKIFFLNIFSWWHTKNKSKRNKNWIKTNWSVKFLLERKCKINCVSIFSSLQSLLNIVNSLWCDCFVCGCCRTSFYCAAVIASFFACFFFRVHHAVLMLNCFLVSMQGTTVDKCEFSLFHSHANAKLLYLFFFVVVALSWIAIKIKKINVKVNWNDIIDEFRFLVLFRAFVIFFSSLNPAIPFCW